MSQVRVGGVFTERVTIGRHHIEVLSVVLVGAYRGSRPNMLGTVTMFIHLLKHFARQEEFGEPWRAVRAIFSNDDRGIHAESHEEPPESRSEESFIQQTEWFLAHQHHFLAQAVDPEHGPSETPSTQLRRQGNSTHIFLQACCRTALKPRLSSHLSQKLLLLALFRETPNERDPDASAITSEMISEYNLAAC